jgi:signal transduction histidine kinase
MLGRLEGAFDRQRALVCQLEALLAEQKRFTADASHELKTPLSVAKIHADLLLHSNPTEAEYKESLESIEDAVDRMSHLVQDLLLLAQTDAGHMSKKRTAIIVRDLVEQARHLHCVSNGPPIDLEQVDPSLTVVGSEDELVRVFSNLVGNAIRHTPAPGKIVVRATMRDEQIVTCIIDTGEGIAAEHLPHLGERFYRVDSSRTREHGGTGLGLSICKRLVENHNGSLTFESEPGKGTTVTVTLPAAQP